MMRAPLPALLVATALAGCATQPPPAPDRGAALPASWSSTPAAAPSAPDAYWTVATDDAVLQSILTDAGDNLDTAIAAARVREANAFLRVARASLFPSITAGANAQLAAADRGVGVSTTAADVSLTAPLDPFGSLRNRSAAAGARADASQADLKLTRLIARRTAGQLYAALRAAQAGRAAAERQTLAAEDSYTLARSRADAGLENGLGVAQARSAADAARARVPAFAQSEAQARLGLEALLAHQPGAFAQRLAPSPPSQLNADRLIDIPASVIARRPDIQAADAQLKAAGFDAQAARADRWPTANLGTSLSQSNASRGVDTGVASAGLSLAGVLFDFGRSSALADAAGARADGQAAQYQRTVLIALSEVETEADRLAQARSEAAAARAAVSSARDQVTLARDRYTTGLSSFIDVLLAERAFADAEIAQAAADGRVLYAGVLLAAALGLGQEP